MFRMIMVTEGSSEENNELLLPTLFYELRTKHAEIRVEIIWKNVNAGRQSIMTVTGLNKIALRFTWPASLQFRLATVKHGSCALSTFGMHGDFDLNLCSVYKVSFLIPAPSRSVITPVSEGNDTTSRSNFLFELTLISAPSEGKWKLH